MSALTKYFTERATTSVAVLIALVVSLSDTSLNIYLSFLIRETTDKGSIAASITAMAAASIFIAWALDSVTNGIMLFQELYYRRMLHKTGSINRSVANIDLVMGVQHHKFYIYVPGLLLSVLLYSYFLYKVSSSAVVINLTLLVVACYPLLRLINWRREKIKSIRRFRNLLNDVPSDNDEYGDVLTKYAKSRYRYFMIDASIGFLMVTIVALVLLFGSMGRGSNELSLSSVLLQVLIFNNVRMLINGLSVYQENRHSMGRVVAELKR